MRKKILGWVMVFGGIFAGIAGVGSSVESPSSYHSLYQGYSNPYSNPTPPSYEIHFIMMAFWVIVAVALILSGWKLAHLKK